MDQVRTKECPSCHKKMVSRYVGRMNDDEPSGRWNWWCGCGRSFHGGFDGRACHSEVEKYFDHWLVLNGLPLERAQ
jgi:hypothetical protein